MRPFHRQFLAKAQRGDAKSQEKQQRRDAEDRLETKLLEALAEPAQEMTPARWEALRDQAKQVAKRRRRA